MKTNDLPLNVSRFDIDRLGSLLDDIAELQAQADALKANIKAIHPNGNVTLLGNAFKAQVVLQSRNTTDWKALAMKLGATDRQISRHTHTTEVLAVRTAFID